MYTAVTSRNATRRLHLRRACELVDALNCRSAGLALLASLALVPGLANAQAPGPEGRVNLIVGASSSFDEWTRDPTESEQEFMRDHYYRMLAYAPYFDSRLSWYPNAWEYKDAYAIYRSSSLAEEQPDWILKDANGQNLYIPYGCSGGVCPQYAADIGNPSFQDYMIESERARLSAGYIGVFVDDVNLSRITVSDGNGNNVTPIDPRTGTEMTLADWRRYFAEFMEKVRDAFPEHEIAHNVHWWTDRSDPFVIRQLDAADWINFERGITDSGIRGGAGRYGFESMLALIDWLHARGKHVVMADDDDSGAQERDYELAFYLLINDGAGDMISSDGDRSRITPGSLWAGYLTDLGYATSGHYRWNELFRRDFECGVVLVNQPDISVSLAQSYVDLSGRGVDAVTLAASSGQVLVSDECERSVAPAPPTNLRADS
jgi:hypothetical protein